MSNFVDLHVHSAYSLVDGFGTPQAVVDRAVELGWSAAAITEHGWLGSTPAFYKACRAAKIKPILGCEMYVSPDHVLGERGKALQTQVFHLSVLALSREGYQNLVAWTSFAMLRENFYYNRPRISISAMAEIAPHPLHHNVVLSGCLGSELNQMLLGSNGNGVDYGRMYVETLKSIFPNFYIELQDHTIKKFAEGDYPAYNAMLEKEAQVRADLIVLAALTRTPTVITNDSHMQHPSQRRAHIAMKSRRGHRDDSHYGKSEGDEISTYLKDYAYYGSYMRDLEKIADREGLPGALDGVAEIVEEANIVLPPFDDFSYSIPFSGYDDPLSRIERRCRKRLRKLEAKHGKKTARKRIAHELESMGDFAHYLLLMSDFIRAAKKAGILTNTRGSAANSLLCYCLEIHDIDSIEYGLTFERFYNPSRKKLPDIDIDIEQDRYEDFMQEIVIPRMEELEGEGQVVQICAYGTLANRSAFRMAATALGIEKEKQDEISKLLPQMIDSGMVEEEIDAYAALKEDYPELYSLSAGIFDAIKNVTQHACGWLFGTKDRPVSEWIPLYLIPSSGAMVTQYDMDTISDLGWVKGDFLRLKALSHVKRTLRLAGLDTMTLDDIPLDDEKTFEMIREGKTQGVHTLQGKENRRGAMEVEAANVHDVIAAVAIYRPALTRPGYDKVYNERRKGHEIVQYPSDIAREILEPTYGLPIFQEQILELGYAVGFDHAEAQELLDAIKTAKGMGRGAKEAFAKVEPKFLKRAKKKGLTDAEAQATWDSIASFQGYGFNKGHATSYGLLAVRTAWLKANYPAEYFTALLDVFPDRQRYIAAARSEGFRFALPSVNRSEHGFTYDKRENAIRVGLRKIKDLGPAAVNEILAGQPFTDYDDFKARTTRRAVNVHRLENLARIGAFAELGIKGEASDETEFEILGFTLQKPRAFRGCKPRHVAAREDSRWRHAGIERGSTLSGVRTSVSKLFWIPPGAKLELKSSQWAQVKTYLLTAVDESGLPYTLMANEDKEWDAKLLKYIHAKRQGTVICLDGAIRQPFDTNGPQGFRFFNVTGSWQGEPQIWPMHEKHARVISGATEQKRRKA